MIPTAFDYERATSLDDALAKLQAADGGGKIIAGGHSLVPLMKLRLSEPQVPDRHRADSRSCAAFARGRQDRRSAPPPSHHEIATSPVSAAAVPAARGRRRDDRRSAGAQSRARSAAASRTPIRRPTIRR